MCGQMTPTKTVDTEMLTGLNIVPMKFPTLLDYITLNAKHLQVDQDVASRGP